jgi:hypothetical protein
VRKYAIRKVGISVGWFLWRHHDRTTLFRGAVFRGLPSRHQSTEFYFGFAGLCMAWQVMFIVIGLAPVRYRMAMLPSMLEKASFAVVIPILYAQDRVAPIWLGFASMDATWFVLFAIAFLRTPSENLANPNKEP